MQAIFRRMVLHCCVSRFEGNSFNLAIWEGDKKLVNLKNLREESIYWNGAGPNWRLDLPPMRLWAVTAFRESVDDDYVPTCIAPSLPSLLPHLFLFQRTVTRLPNFYF